MPERDLGKRPEDWLKKEEAEYAMDTMKRWNT